MNFLLLGLTLTIVYRIHQLEKKMADANATVNLNLDKILDTLGEIAADQDGLMNEIAELNEMLEEEEVSSEIAEKVETILEKAQALNDKVAPLAAPADPAG